MFVFIKFPTKIFKGPSFCTLLDLCVSSLRRAHANLHCIVPIVTDDPRRESNIQGAEFPGPGGTLVSGKFAPPARRDAVQAGVLPLPLHAVVGVATRFVVPLCKCSERGRSAGLAASLGRGVSLFCRGSGLLPLSRGEGAAGRAENGRTGRWRERVA